MGNAKTVNLTASLVTAGGTTKLQLTDGSNKVNPTISFNKSDKNEVVIECADTAGFYFAGLTIYGVAHGGTTYNPAAAGALKNFDIEITPQKITMKDKIKDNTQILDYEYTIFAQRTSDGQPFGDDPRIINTTG